MLYNIGDRVQAKCDLIDNSGEDPNFLIPQGTEGVIFQGGVYPVVEFQMDNRTVFAPCEPWEITKVVNPDSPT